MLHSSCSCQIHLMLHLNYSCQIPMPRRSSRNSTTAKLSASKKRSTNGREQSDPPTRAKRQRHQAQEDTARYLTSDDIPTIVTSIFQSFAASRTSGNRTNESSSITNESSPSNSHESSTNNAIASGSNNANTDETSAANTPVTSNENRQADNTSQP